MPPIVFRLLSVLLIACAGITAAASWKVPERMLPKTAATGVVVAGDALPDDDRQRIMGAGAGLANSLAVRLAVGVPADLAACFRPLEPRDILLLTDAPAPGRATLSAGTDISAALGDACVREALPAWLADPAARMSVPGQIVAVAELVRHRIGDGWFADPIGRAQNTYPAVAFACAVMALFAWLFGRSAARGAAAPESSPKIKPTDIPLPELRAMARGQAEIDGLRKLEEEHAAASACLAEAVSKHEAAQAKVDEARGAAASAEEVNFILRPIARTWRQHGLEGAEQDLEACAAAEAQAREILKSADGALSEKLAELAERYIADAQVRHDARIRRRRVWRAFAAVLLLLVTSGAALASAAAVYDYCGEPLPVRIPVSSVYMPPSGSMLALAAATPSPVGDRLRQACMVAPPSAPTFTPVPSPQGVPMASSGGSLAMLPPSITPSCEVGKPCGKACIAQDKVCHVDEYPGFTDGVDCRVGKRCGEACIAKDKECHVGEVAAGPPPICDTGKRCGSACIAVEKECRVDRYIARADGPVCEIGKRCGDTCIADDKACHVSEPKPTPVAAPAPVVVPPVAAPTVSSSSSSSHSRQPSASAPPSSGDTYTVHGYTKKDGTVVAPYERHRPHKN